MSVIVDSYSKDEEAWKIVNLSDPESVKGLLRLRKTYDLLFEERVDSAFSSSVDLGEQLEEVTCTYAWLDSVLKQVTFSKQQESILNRYIDGYEISEIAEQDGQTTRNINKILNTICQKVVDEKHRQWLIWVHTNKLNTELKTCNTCKQDLPKTEYFYRVRNRENLIYRNDCRKCESNSR